MHFCPTCANMLRYEMPNMGRKGRFFCPTCPYICEIENQVKIKKRLHLKKKPPLDQIEIFDEEEAMKNASKTEAPCQKCNSREAYYVQRQTRSADEPMTTYYKCCNTDCNNTWKED